jgi:hypothetical protein
VAQSVAVVRGNLPSAAGSVNLTSSGLGTVNAAIIIACDANTTNNPQAPARMSIGLWDGTNQRACAFTNVDNSGTSRTFRHSDDGLGVILPTDQTTAAACTYSVSATTDGITLTLVTDNTGVERYVTAILLSGVTAKIVDVDGTTSGGTTESASLGFAPTAAVVASIGNAGTSGNDVTAFAGIMSFGAALKSTGDNYCTFWGETNDADTSTQAQKFANNRVAGQVYNDTYTWGGEITTWGADTLTMTTRDGNSSGDRVFILALGGDVSLDLGELTTITSTGTDDVTTTVDPDAVLISAQSATSTTIETGADADGWSIGMSDGTNDYSHNMTTGDGLGTSNAQSVAQSDRLIDVDYESAGFNALVDASMDSLGTAKFTLNYSAVSGTARKGWWLAFGPATGGGGTAVPVFAHHYRQLARA